MPPSFPFPDKVYVVWVTSKFPSRILYAYHATQREKLSNIIFRKFGFMVIRSPLPSGEHGDRIWSGSQPSFSLCISRVVESSSYKQMIRTNTKRGIAVVAYLKSFWNRASVDQPRVSVSENPFSFNRVASVFWSFGVRSLESTSLPEPATITPFNILPKSLNRIASLAGRFTGIGTELIFSGIWAATFRNKINSALFARSFFSHVRNVAATGETVNWELRGLT